jgi:uncharacterized membrane protein
MKSRRTGRFFLILVLLAFGWSAFHLPRSAYGAEDEDENRPERLIEMAVEYPGVEIPADDDVSMDIIFHNKGRSHENVEVGLASVPDGWDAKIKTYKFKITGVHVPAGDDKRITFEADPGQDVQPGKYEFKIEARTLDDRFQMAQTIAVIVTPKKEGKKEPKGVTLTTSYPVLRGPSDAEFEFSIEVDSKLDQDAVFDLFAKGPEGWDFNFKPAYESKFISSLRIMANQSKTVAIEVKPAPFAPAGEYPINVRVASGDANGEVEVMVVLTGTYGLEAGTPSGLLSLDAKQGKPANLSIYVRNTGSAANHDIQFMSFKPENWKVEFEPEKLDILEPGDLKQIEMTITPHEDALVGDYSVAVNVQGEKASKNMEFRITVKASTAWGWIGIGIIVLVIAGLTGLFRWLGRR